jgi:hypothetical protein
MKTKILHFCLAFLILFLTGSCREEQTSVKYNFDSINDRVWIGEDFWSVPLEDWKVWNGRVEFTGEGQQSALTILPYTLSGNERPFSVRIEMGLLDTGRNTGAAGMIIGSQAIEEEDIKAAVYFGSGIRVGVNTEGYAFIDQNAKRIPDDFDWSNFYLHLIGERSGRLYCYAWFT